jgi:cell division protein FtsQ
MPAAPRGERKGPRAAPRRPPATRTKARPAGPPPRAVSKLHAGRRMGFPRRAASLAATLMLLLVGVAALATGGRGAWLADSATAIAHAPMAGLGLTVREVHLQGVSPAAQDEVAAAVAIKSGTPILGVDLAAVRARVERVGWVRSARVIRLFPDTLVVAVTERPLMAVWQDGGRTVVVTNNGAVAGHIEPRRFAKLPLIVGDGANLAAQPLIALLRVHPRLWSRVAAMVRVDMRRWDVQLKDGGVVALPADGEAAALARLDRLDESSRILGLGFARIDLRDPEMVVVRPRGAVAAVAPAAKVGASVGGDSHD